ncbi:MAG TPA: sulfotransferase [Chromatiales bacterium]|nr:sulfotransferase [Chromatiales bacterium]
MDNYMLVGLIWLLFPNAKIVNVQRDPVDTCYSCYRRLFNLASIPYSYDLHHLASKYRDYQQIMDHWQEVLPDYVHTVRYEQLVREQKQVTQELLAYCDLPWDDRCMEFYRNTRTVLTSSNAQVRQRLYTDAVDRWKAYEPYLGPLMDLLEF